MISDSTSKYQSAAKELRKLLKSPLLETHFSKRTVQWKFIPKCAPWYSDFGERFIGLTKLNLKQVLGRANVRLFEVQTIVTEIGNVNDKQPLTPSHLLYGRSIAALPHPLSEENEWN